MEQYEYIRIAKRVYGRSIKSIARETGHSKNTVRKVLRAEKQDYRKRAKQSYPVLGPHLEIIDKWLLADRELPVNQRHTARRIFNRLRQEHHYQGGESTVRRYVRYAKVRLGFSRTDAFIPGDPTVGQEAEVDWGTILVELNGHRERLKVFVMRSKYSGKHFVRCYRCERQQAFFDAHIHAFSFFGGIFPTLIYDNLKAAVHKVYRGKKRDLQERYRRFQSYYTFTARFCNPSKGHEKGGVEGLIGYVRRNYFVPIPAVRSLEELNTNLLELCHSYGGHRLSGREGTVQSHFEEEKKHLLALVDVPFNITEQYFGKVDKYSTIMVDKNRYSVPTEYVSYKVSALLSVSRVDIYHERKQIASHERYFGGGKWQLDPHHYLQLIQERPQSFSSARPIKAWRSHWPGSHEQLLDHFCEKQGDTNGIRDFISVLQLYQNYAQSEVEAAVELAVESMISSSEGVIHLLAHTFEASSEVASLESWPSLPKAEVCGYGQLVGGMQ